MIDLELARALGVRREAPPELVAEYLLRQAGTQMPAADIPPRAAEWFVQLGFRLIQHSAPHRYSWGAVRPRPLTEVAVNVAEEAIVKLYRKDAPSVLPVIAPLQLVPTCESRDLARVCRVLTKRHLAGFCLRILKTWRADGFIREPREEDHDDTDEAAGF
jgi:hypothetical protein